MLERVTGPRTCPKCGKGIQRYSNDKFLECHRCGWTIHLPIIRWLTAPTWISYYLSHPKEAAITTIKYGVFWLIVTGLIASLTPASFLSFGGLNSTFNGSIPQNVSIEIPQGNYSPTPASEDGDGSSVTIQRQSGGNGEDGTDISRIERLVIQYTNQERQQRGLPTLRSNSRISTAARRHSERMAERDELYHGNILPRYPCRRTAGENAAQNYVGPEQEVARDLVDQWMNSPGHRKNILSSKFTEIGVGIAIDGGRVYATQGFCG